MSKVFKIRETNIPNMFRMGFCTIATSGPNGNSQSWTVANAPHPEDHRNDCTNSFSVVIASCASIMSESAMKDKEHKTAIVFQSPKGAGSMLMACISEFIPSDSGEGEFNVYFSFDPEDIKGVPEENIHSFTDLAAIRPWAATYSDIYYQLHSRKINNEELINETTILVIQNIIDWLSDAATESEVVQLIIDDEPNYGFKRGTPYTEADYYANFITYAIASVEVIKGVKVMSMTFGEEMKALAKGNNDNA